MTNSLSLLYDGVKELELEAYHEEANDFALCDECYSTVALVPPMSTMDVWLGIT